MFMKKTVLLLCLFVIAQLSYCQVKEVVTDLYGNFVVKVRIGDQGYISINQRGRVVETNMQENLHYYSDFNDYEAGKVKKVGDIDFSYYSGFNDYEKGKLKKIGDISFSYYSDFNDYEVGRVKKIGNIGFSYYSDFNDYESGKVKKIGEESYSYFSQASFDYQVGQLKSGNHSFTNNGIYFRVINTGGRYRKK